jgi:hypothetical protein
MTSLMQFRMTNTCKSKGSGAVRFVFHTWVADPSLPSAFPLPLNAQNLVILNRVARDLREGAGKNLISILS